MVVDIDTPARVLIWVRWDSELEVWYGGSDHVPGLILEHRDFNQLVEAAFDLAPELIASNAPKLKGLPIHIVADRIHVPA
jgi:hypothetical protein